MASSLQCPLLLPPSSRPFCSLGLKNIIILRNANNKIKKMKAFSNKNHIISMVEQTTPQGAGANAVYAKEMERVSAKESLLLALKDAGGFDALVSGRVTDMQRADLNEKIVGLERLNPTPRPTTSPFLEGKWKYEWFGAGNPGLFAARLVFERFPPMLTNLVKMDVLIKDSYATITTNVNLLNSIETYLIVLAKLTVEGPLRLKEEYVEGTLEPSKFKEETIPEQLKGVYGQALNSVQQLLVPIQAAVSNGLKVPLGGTYQRLFMISYLDEEILLVRDASGTPEVLTRLDLVPSPVLDPITEYDS